MNDGSSGMTIPNATIFANVFILAKTAPFTFLLTYDTINLHFFIILSYHVRTSIDITLMPLMIDKGWLAKPCFIDEIDISYCNNICRHLYLGQDCTIQDILDIRYNKSPFDSVPINNIMWQINIDIFHKNNMCILHLI